MCVCVCVCVFKGCVCVRAHARLVTQLCLILCDSPDLVHQAPLSMEFCRQEYWSGLPFPVPGDLPDPGIEPTSPVSPALAGGSFTTSATRGPA